METYTISNVDVEFPFRPYPCQLVYMEKVIQCLQKGTNAILESPTGTGKTLCLLCATLAWREDLVRKQQGAGRMEGEDVDMWDMEATGHRSNFPKIIYASRTHSQLSQVIHELKNTRYRPKMAIIGSREQLCIHPEVSKKETNAEKVHLCRAKVQSHSCIYNNYLDVKRLKATERVMDIEDLVLAGSRQRMCPYYLARELKKEADIIFMPYNYILDVKTRRLHGIDIQGTVVILDEAHNIERVCEESASFDLTSSDIAHCIDDVNHLLTLKKEEESYEEAGEMGEDIQDLLNLKEFFLTVEQNLDSIQFDDPNKREVVKPGQFIFDFFAAAGLTHSTSAALTDQCGKAISLLTTEAKSLHRNGNNVQKFMDALKIIFSQPYDPRDQGSSAQPYKVFIKAEEAKKKRTDVWTVSAADSKKESRTLSYWCFSPGHAMADLTAQGVKSIVLTSGTLSPLDSFCSELQVDFPIEYEGPHVISKDQIWVGVVTKGCDGVPLNSSYANRFSVKYQTSLGNTIVNFSRTIPFGLLVFFPSYPIMYSCVDKWRENGIFQRIEQQKPVFLEPRRKIDFNPTMDAFYEKIADPKHNGAAFFAVCRGKVSEGLDFADANGRAVIITGLPYPPRMDPKVALKMEYLEEARKKPCSKHLKGEEWYRQQASRAVNQAVGRVIRHRHDYGAIILCDERFAYSSAINQLPQWVRPYAKTYDRFGLVQRDLTQFFRNAEKEYGKPAPKKQVGDGGETSSTHVSDDIRTSIVVRDPSRKSTNIQAQDASVVDTHVIRQVPQASLAKLRVESGKEAAGKSLFTSLVKCDQSEDHSRKVVDLHSPASESPRGPSFSESIMQTDRPQPSSSSSSTAAYLVSKKALKVSKGHSQTDKMAGVAGFISQLQANLSDEAYGSFKKAFAAYKKNEDIYAYIESLKEIFKQPSLFHLLQGMHTFVHEQHRETYSIFYHEFTGKTLHKSSSISTGKRKPQARSSKDEPKQKLAKSEYANNYESDTKMTKLLNTHHLNAEMQLNHGRTPQ